MRMRPIIPDGMLYAVSPTAAVIMGDSLMYVVLPVAAVEFGAGDQFGLAGVVLDWARTQHQPLHSVGQQMPSLSLCTSGLGLRWPFVASIAVGALTTLAYGLGSGLVLLLLARAVWGISYSHMRLAAQLTAFGVGTSAMRGRLMGFFNSGQRLGSFIAVTAGALLFQLTSREVTFAALAGVGLLGMIIATRVPDLRPERIVSSGGGLRDSLNPWDLAVSRLPEYGPQAKASPSLDQLNAVRHGLRVKWSGHCYRGPLPR